MKKTHRAKDYPIFFAAGTRYIRGYSHQWNIFFTPFFFFYTYSRNWNSWYLVIWRWRVWTQKKKKKKSDYRKQLFNLKIQANPSCVMKKLFFAWENFNAVWNI